MPYIKDFGNTQPTILTFPSADTAPVKYGLTLSAILLKNNAENKIIDRQEELIKDISYTEKIRHGIYKYPAKSLHFSILDFEDLGSIEYKDQESYEKAMSDKIDIIKNTITLVVKEIAKPKDPVVKFGFIYTGCTGKELCSLAIQAFLSEEQVKYIKKLHENLSDKLSGDGVGAIKIKGFSDGHLFKDEHRFAINLIRFFRNPTDHEYARLVEKVSEINLNSSKHPLGDFDLREITFVVSDNWLSNNNFDLENPIKL